MRKISVFVLSVTLSIFMFCSCNQGGMSDKAKKNLAAVNAINKMFTTGDYSKVGDYIAADAVDHAGMSGEVKGLDNIKAEFDQFNKSMSDMKNDVVKELADDDYVFQWSNQSGKMKADEMGMKAGDIYNFSSIEVSKFNADGKITDHWTFMNPNDMMKMMGGQQGNMGSDMGAKMDSTKMK